VGYAHGVWHGVPSGHRGIGWVNVLPEARRSGAGAAPWQAVLDVRTPERVKASRCRPTTVTPRRSTSPSRTASGGAGLHQESVLDLDTIEAHRGRATADRAPDVPLRAMPDDATEDDWRAFAEASTG
jgi:hypothetical protein